MTRGSFFVFAVPSVIPDPIGDPASLSLVFHPLPSLTIPYRGIRRYRKPNTV